jgi:hypothetical protein
MVQPIRIDPAAIYDDAALVLTLDLSSATLARARRNGRLRFTRQGRRTLYLGQWLLDWLVSAPPRETGAAHAAK